MGETRRGRGAEWAVDFLTASYDCDDPMKLSGAAMPLLSREHYVEGIALSHTTVGFGHAVLPTEEF